MVYMGDRLWARRESFTSERSRPDSPTPWSKSRSELARLWNEPLPLSNRVNDQMASSLVRGGAGDGNRTHIISLEGVAGGTRTQACDLYFRRWEIRSAAHGQCPACPLLPGGLRCSRHVVGMVSGACRGRCGNRRGWCSLVKTRPGVTARRSYRAPSGWPARGALSIDTNADQGRGPLDHRPRLDDRMG